MKDRVNTGMGSRLSMFVFNLSLPASVVAVFVYGESLRPSLLPRPLAVQLAITAVSVLVAYGLAQVIVRLARAVIPRLQFELPRRIRYGAFAVLALGAIGITVLYSSFQVDHAESLGMASVAANPAILLLAFWPALYVVMLLWRALVWLARFFESRLPRSWGSKLRYSLVGLVLLMLFNAASTGALLYVRARQQNLQRSFIAGVEQPAVSLHSGSEDSLVAWEDLGKQGRAFVAGATTKDEIVEATDVRGQQPIRHYIGIDTADSLEAQADLMIAELIRSDAFLKESLILYTPTGTGWVNPAAVRSAEFLLRGDVASVAVQYSLASSFVEYLLDETVAQQSAQYMYDRLTQAIEDQPRHRQPTLYLYGESLGALGSQASLTEVQEEFTRHIGGALWVGGPAISPLWKQELTKHSGPIWDPVRGQSSVQFATNVARFKDKRFQQSANTVFLYNLTDPIVWLSRSSVLSQPAYYEEPRQKDISEHNRWTPGVTYLHTLGDVLRASSAPSGVGHNYVDEIPWAWVGVLPLSSWEIDEIELLFEEVLR